MTEFPYKTLDEEEKEKHDEKNKDKRLQEIEDIKAILARPEGIRFFKRLIREGGVFTTTMTGNAWTYFWEGRRNYVNSLIADVVEAASEKIALLMMEDKND